MSVGPASGTSPSLLGLLRRDPTDQAAWARFVDRYGPTILGWCRQWHLQDADAEDVTQAVLVKLAQRMRDFAYDPAKSFRGWLRRLTRHAFSDFWDAQRVLGRGTGDSQVLQRLQTAAAREDLGTRLEAEYDLELLELAMERVRLRFAPHRWQAFHLTAFEGLTGVEVAARLGMPVATVFVTRSKVQAMLKKEIRRLEASEEPTAEEQP